MLLALIRRSHALCSALLEVLNNPEMVVQLGVVDGRVAELTFVLNLCALLDQELDDEQVVVHRGVVQRRHAQEVFRVKLGTFFN